METQAILAFGGLIIAGIIIRILRAEMRGKGPLAWILGFVVIVVVAVIAGMLYAAFKSGGG